MPDDHLDVIPSITPEREDIDNRRGRRSFVPGHSTVDLPLKVTPGTAAQSLLQGTKTIALLIVLTMGTLAGVIYLFVQLQQTRQSLVVATQRVEQLENRLVTTDTTLTKSEVLLAAKLKSMDALIDSNKTEVHKLWNASEKNTKSLQAQNADIQQQKPILQSVTEQAKRTADQVATDSVLLGNVDSMVKEAVQRMEIVQENLTNLNTDTSALKDRQLRLEGDAGKRLTTLEDTAKSTDVFRRNTLDELRKLREEITKSQTATVVKPAP